MYRKLAMAVRFSPYVHFLSAICGGRFIINVRLWVTNCLLLYIQSYTFCPCKTDKHVLAAFFDIPTAAEYILTNFQYSI